MASGEAPEIVNDPPARGTRAPHLAHVL